MISVIVPVYKSEKTLAKCVDSILKQTEKDLEVLLVVNGPPDESGILCERLALTDERIRVIIEPRRGVSIARNSGLKAAKGEYIRFVDSDDYIPIDSLSKMKNLMEMENADMVIAGFAHMYYGQEILKMPSKSNGCFVTHHNFREMKKLYEGGFLNMPWNKLYKKELILKEFDHELSLGEDLLFNMNYMLETTKIAVLNENVCYYIQDDRGTTLSSKQRDDRAQMALLIYEKSKEFFITLFGTRVEEKLDFLETKVVTTFLDEIELLGFSKEKPSFKMKQCREMMKEINDFVLEHSGSNIHLSLLDYKVIYFWVRRNNAPLVYANAFLRARVVQCVRAMKKWK